MKILIICSKAFYKDIAPIKEKLEKMGHVVELPNSYYEPDAEKKSWEQGEKAHSEFKARMFKMSEERIATMDAVLTLNFDKNGKKNYIGGATFIEIYEAYMKNKKIFKNFISISLSILLGLCFIYPVSAAEPAGETYNEFDMIMQEMNTKYGLILHGKSY